MGYGDELIAAGRARRRWEATGRPVRILDQNRRPRSHELWHGLPYVAQPDAETRAEEFDSIVDDIAARSYLASMTPERYEFRETRPWPGTLEFTPEETRLSAEADGAIVLEPNEKPGGSPCKAWGWDNWCRLAERLADRGLEIVQPSYGQPALPLARQVATPGFRDAAALLRGARAAVLPEGGLHHAAAAVGCRAVVLFGAFGDPRATGYAEHINIWIDRETDRGWRGPHAGAEAAMRLITPDHVAGALDLLILGAP